MNLSYNLDLMNYERPVHNTPTESTVWTEAIRLRTNKHSKMNIYTCSFYCKYLGPRSRNLKPKYEGGLWRQL